MKRKIAAILAADVASYSRLVSEDEEETLARLRSYRSVFSDFIARFRGRIFNTAGDAILAEFDSAVDAVRCAIDIQESLRSRNLAYPPSRQMKFRIGITIGDVVEQDGDLLGDGVNIAARLEGIAPEGGICISRSVYEATANKLAIEFADRGKQNLKNIPEPVHAYTFAMGAPSLKKRPGISNWPLLLLAAASATALAAGATFVVLHFKDKDVRTPNSVIAVKQVHPPQDAIKPKLPAQEVQAAGPDTAGVSLPKTPAPSVLNTEPKAVAASDLPSTNATAEPAQPDRPDESNTAPEAEAVQDPPLKALSSASEAGASEVATTEVPSSSAPTENPRVTDDFALQARLNRQWSGCRSGDDLDAVVKACSELIRSNAYSGPTLASVYLELGRVQRDNKLPDEAIKSYSEAIRVSPSAKAFNDRGIAYYDKGQWNEAIADYSEALRLDPTNGEAFNNRAWTKLKAGKAQVALGDANEAVRLLPSKAYAVDTRAHIHEALGNRDAAIQDYRKALELSPNNKGSLQGLKRLGSTF